MTTRTTRAYLSPPFLTPSCQSKNFSPQASTFVHSLTVSRSSGSLSSVSSEALTPQAIALKPLTDLLTAKPAEPTTTASVKPPTTIFEMIRQTCPPDCRACRFSQDPEARKKDAAQDRFYSTSPFGELSPNDEVAEAEPSEASDSDEESRCIPISTNVSRDIRHLTFAIDFVKTWKEWPADDFPFIVRKYLDEDQEIYVFADPGKDCCRKRITIILARNAIELSKVLRGTPYKPRMTVRELKITLRSLIVDARTGR